MIQVLILEDNISKYHKIVMSEYLKWEKKTVVLTGYELEAERLLKMQVGTPLEALYLDYELHPGAGDGLSLLESLSPASVQKVYGTTFSKEMMRKFHQLCREKNIEFEALRL